jgi:broad-specificity NMP kinase
MNPETMEAAQDRVDEALSGMETERLKEILEERGYKVEKIREAEE